MHLDSPDKALIAVPLLAFVLPVKVAVPVAVHLPLLRGVPEPIAIATWTAYQAAAR